MNLLGLSIRKSTKGCQYSENVDSVCYYLSKIVEAQNNKMFKEFTDQRELITKNHQIVMRELKRLEIRSINDQNENNRRLMVLEKYVKPMNMIVFDSLMRYKWAFLVWVIIQTVISILLIIKK